VAQELKTRLGRYLMRQDVIVTSSTPVRREVLVTGEVLRPGAVPLRQGDALLDALGAAGGVTPAADAVHATLVRRGQPKPEPLQIDLLLKGDLTRNLSLNDGDIIQVPKKEIASYQVLGQVKSPGTRPLVGPIHVLDALLEAGLTDRADRNRVMLTRKGQAQPIAIDLDQLFKGDTAANALIEADDVVTVGSRVVVQVAGEVKDPGLKLMRNGGTVMECVAVSGGFTLDSDRTQIQVTHRDGTTETCSLADVKTLIGGPVVKEEDTIIVGRVKPQFVTLNGAVRKEGQIPFRSSLKVTDVLMAAGLQENAKWKEIRVYRGEDGPGRKILVFNLEDYLKKPQATNLALEAGDRIFVEAQPRRKPGLFQKLIQAAPLASLFFAIMP
jgi:protein involved in polysaccharide export with SLBB domain